MQPKGVIAGLGELTGAGRRPAEYAARLLQRDGSGLWPRIGTGNRIMISVPEMISLWAALVLGFGRASEGPGLVKEYRQLQASSGVLYHSIDGHAEQVDLSWKPSSMPLLADMHARWLNDAIDPAGRTSHLHDAERQNPTIRIMLTSPLTAELVLPAGDGGGSFERYGFAVPGAERTVAQPSRVHRLEVVHGLPELQAFAAMAREARVALLSEAPAAVSAEKEQPPDASVAPRSQARLPVRRRRDQP